MSCFDFLREHEEILILKRKHRIMLFPIFGFAFLGYLAGIFFIFFIPTLLKENIEGSGKIVFTVIVSLYFLFITLIAFVQWFSYHLSLDIVTDKNIIDISQHSPFFRRISELELTNIEDISATQKGFLQTAFHYGDVHIQTAGEKPNFLFEKIPDPYGVSKKIMDIRQKYGAKNNTGGSVATTNIQQQNTSPESQPSQNTSKENQPPQNTSPDEENV